MSGTAAGGAAEGEEPVAGGDGHDRGEERRGGRRAGTGGGEPAIGSGPGRALVAVYGLFTLAAGARAAVQIATRFSEAPVAYTLSAFAAAVYLVLTIALARGDRRLALAACCVELAGVLVVGTLSMADPAAFPSATVWSGYGSGYVFIPLVLPFVGLYWLLRRR